MKDRDMFAEHPALLQEDFRKDIAVLLEAEQSVVTALLKHIREQADYETLVEEKNWVHIAESTRLTIDQLVKIFRPVRYLALVAMKEEATPEQLLSALAERGVLPDASDQSVKQAGEIISALLPIMQALDAETPPKLPVGTSGTGMDLVLNGRPAGSD